MALAGLHLLLALSLAPLLPGVANRVKAFVGGRQGPPTLQLYRDLFKLLAKSPVYGRTTTWVFGVGPVVGLAALLVALLFLPFAGAGGALGFGGDLILFAALLGLARFATMLSALDTGWSFEGMGASREAAFAALAEPALLVTLAALARLAGETSLAGIFAALGPEVWAGEGAALALAAGALLLVFLTENSRLPVDDPDTHLELAMIHEAMILDHGGPDLALLHYTAALRLWALGALLTGVCIPCRTGTPWDLAAALAGMLALAAAVGGIESTMARLRLFRVPHLLAGAGALGVFAFVLVLR